MARLDAQSLNRERKHSGGQRALARHRRRRPHPVGLGYLRFMRVDIGGGTRLYVDIDGAGLVPDGATMRQRPTILFLHGGPGMDHSLFKSSRLTELSDVAQLVFYDHRGQGRSDGSDPTEWNLDQWADDVVALCDALEITDPIVYGASFGGMVAQRYLARHPHHPSKVVLACTSARIDVDAIVDAFRVGVLT